MTHREWLESQNLKFNIGNRKENTLVWIANDATYRPAHGDTGLRLEPKHLRGQVFPALYRALEADVQRLNEEHLEAGPQAGRNTAQWEEEMLALCHRRQWLRLFIQHGGISTVVAERDDAQSRVEWESNRQLRLSQAHSDAKQIASINAAIQRGAYVFKPERLLVDAMKVLRDDINRPLPSPPVCPSPDVLTRSENKQLAQALDSHS